tara:strand:- start:1243 stop:2490 length:1248 start_codon:yes stop_codon:yes gene_type:complete
MKILKISTGFDISYNGGIPIYVRNVSEKLVQIGNSVSVLYSNDLGLNKTYNFKQINFKSKLRPNSLKSVINNNDIKKIEKIILKENPAIIHVHMMIDLPANVLKMFKKHAKLVISLHDYSYLCNRIVLVKSKTGKNCTNSNENIDCNDCIDKIDTLSSKYIRYASRKIRSLLDSDKFTPSSGHHEKFLQVQSSFRNADLIIAVSSQVKNIYENSGFKNKNFVVNHIGNYTAENNFRNNFVERRFINSTDVMNFGFIGNLSKLKGASIFLKLIENSKHNFIVYGGINQEIQEKIKTKKNVFYKGKYKHEDLPHILKDIDFGLVLPIWEDNAPQVVFELLNAGIPILGTRMGGLPDFINNSNGFLFNNDELGIKTAKNFINSNKVYDLYNRVVNKIDGTKKPEEHANELLGLYNQIL